MLTVETTTIEDVLIFTPKVIEDFRGNFMESFNQKAIENFIGKIHFVQDNESTSHFGVLRGLHYQKPPFEQAKLVRVVHGKVLDVAVDMRIGSPTFGKHVAVELSGENKKQLFVPRGFAHGFLVLSPTATFQYKIDNYYSPAHDTGVMYNDPAIGIHWGMPETELIVSEKDKNLPNFEQSAKFSYATKS